jgi:hypothetical protein
MSSGIKTKIGSSKQKDGGGSGSNVTHCKVLKLDQGKNGSNQNENGSSQGGKGRHEKTHEAKKVAKLVVAKLDSTKKVSKMPNGRKEEMSLPLNVESTKGRASTKKNSSKREALKDEVHLVEMV